MHAPGALGSKVKTGVGRLGVAGTTVSHEGVVVGSDTVTIAVC
jgi:hypothetical protein